MRKGATVFALVFLSVLVGCTSTDTQPDAMNDVMLTIEELKEYDGTNGSAYVAIDGIIYDVTDVPAWKHFEHNGHKAGTDLSDAIELSPHGREVLEDLPKVGTIKE